MTFFTSTQNFFVSNSQSKKFDQFKNLCPHLVLYCIVSCLLANLVCAVYNLQVLTTGLKQGSYSFTDSLIYTLPPEHFSIHLPLTKFHCQ